MTPGIKDLLQMYQKHNKLFLKWALIKVLVDKVAPRRTEIKNKMVLKRHDIIAVSYINRAPYFYG